MLAISLAVVLIISAANADITELTQQNFFQHIGKGDWMHVNLSSFFYFLTLIFLYFYIATLDLMMTITSLELCSKCKRIEPLFDQLAQNTSGFNFGDVDCEAHKLICQVNKIDKYPQIKLIRGNVAFATFEGDFNEKEMREWVEKMTGPSLLIVGDEEKKDGGDTDETIQSSSQLHNKKQNTNSRITTDEFLNQLQEIQERSSFVMISSEPPSQRYVQTPDRMQQHKSLMSQNRKSFKNEGIQDNEDIKMSITQYEEIANEYYSIGSRFYYIQYPMTKGPIETSTNLNDGEKEKEKEKVFDKQKMFDQREQIDRDTGNVIQNAQIVHMATKQTEELRGALHDLHIEKVLEQLGMSREEMIAFKEISWSAKEELRIMRQQSMDRMRAPFSDEDRDNKWEIIQKILDKNKDKQNIGDQNKDKQQQKEEQIINESQIKQNLNQKSSSKSETQQDQQQIPKQIPNQQSKSQYSFQSNSKRKQSLIQIPLIILSSSNGTESIRRFIKKHSIQQNSQEKQIHSQSQQQQDYPSYYSFYEELFTPPLKSEFEYWIASHQYPLLPQFKYSMRNKSDLNQMRMQVIGLVNGTNNDENKQFLSDFLQASIHFEDNDKLFFVIADEQAFSNFSGYYYINSHRIPDVFVVSWIKHLNWTINIGNNSWNKDSIISFLSSVLNKKIRPGSPYQLDKSGISRFTENHPVIIGISIGLLIFGIGILAVLLLLRSEDRHQQIENMRLAKIRAVEQTALKEAELYKQRLLQEEEDEAELAQDIDEQELEREIILKLMKEKARKEKKKKKKQQQKKSNLEMEDQSVRNGNNEIQDEDNQTHFKDGIIENKESGNADKIQEDPHSDKVE